MNFDEREKELEKCCPYDATVEVYFDNFDEELPNDDKLSIVKYVLDDNTVGYSIETWHGLLSMNEHAFLNLISSMSNVAKTFLPTLSQDSNRESKS